MVHHVLIVVASIVLLNNESRGTSNPGALIGPLRNSAEKKHSRPELVLSVLGPIDIDMALCSCEDDLALFGL